MNKAWRARAYVESEQNAVSCNKDRVQRRYGDKWQMRIASSSTSHVRMEKVIRMRAAIASGCYQVSAAALAQKLIVHMLGNSVV